MNNGNVNNDFFGGGNVDKQGNAINSFIPEMNGQPGTSVGNNVSLDASSIGGNSSIPVIEPVMPSIVEPVMHNVEGDALSVAPTENLNSNVMPEMVSPVLGNVPSMEVPTISVNPILSSVNEASSLGSVSSGEQVGLNSTSAPSVMDSFVMSGEMAISQNMNANVGVTPMDGITGMNVPLTQNEPNSTVVTSSVESNPTSSVTANSSNVNVSNETTNSNIVSVGKFLGMMILFSIPVVGLIMLILKIFDKKDKNISNFAKAYLLLGCIGGVVVVVLYAVLFGILGLGMSQIDGNVSGNDNRQDESNYESSYDENDYDVDYDYDY